MEQRIYHGNVSVDGLANHLVTIFNGSSGLIAQQVGQGDHVLVQIGHPHSGGTVRNAIGVSITSTAEGVSVSTGQSNWIDLADPGLAGMLIGAIFFPPLLIFPFLKGIRTFGTYQQIWETIEAYCIGAGGVSQGATVAHGIHCPRCGSINQEDAQFCTTCGAAIHSTPQGEPPVGAAPMQQTCPECGQLASGKFCSNCGARLAAVPA